MSKVILSRCSGYNLDSMCEIISKMFDSLGGLDTVLAGPAGKVLIKPNMMAGHPPEDNVCTHPEFLRAVIRVVKKSGKKILVGDSPAGLIGKWDIENVWRETGMNKVIEDEQVEKVIFEAHKTIQKSVEGFTKLESQLLTSYVDECDAVINVPKLKTHTYMILSGAVKNLFGMVPGKYKGQLHCQFPQPPDFAEVIAGTAEAIKPAVTIVDGVWGLEGDGPGTAGTPRNFGLIIGGNDTVSIDKTICDITGICWEDIPVLQCCKEKKWGELDDERITTEYIGEKFTEIDDFKLPAKFQIKNLDRFTRMVYAPTRVFPLILPDKCIRCEKCIESCPVGGIIENSSGILEVKGEQCIECCCCSEVCTSDAIDLYGGKK